MGQSSLSQAVIVGDVVSVSKPVSNKNEDSVSVAYGPNIMRLLLGYDSTSDTLTKAAQMLHERASLPSERNKTKATKLLKEIETNAFESGREMMNWSDFEETWMNDINDATYEYKKRYGNKEVLTLLNVDNNVCMDQSDAILDCFAQNSLPESESQESNQVPFSDTHFAKLNCLSLIDAYNECVHKEQQGVLISSLTAQA